MISLGPFIPGALTSGLSFLSVERLFMGTELCRLYPLRRMRMLNTVQKVMGFVCPAERVVCCKFLSTREHSKEPRCHSSPLAPRVWIL